MHGTNFKEEGRGVSMLITSTAYRYYLDVYGASSATRYDTHNKSELRSVYNNMVKINKD